MPQLVDTTIRLLSQEPLADRVSRPGSTSWPPSWTRRGSRAWRSRAAAASTAPCARRVESPWERIRSIRARCSTPLGMALRGRFLVGSRPVSADLVRRFVASAAAKRHRRLPAARSAERPREPARGGRRDPGRREGALRRARAQPGPDRGDRGAPGARARLPELGASRVLIHDPASSLDPAKARELVERVGEASGLPVGLHCQGAGGVGLGGGDRGRARRRRADRGRPLPDRALAPPRLGRGADAVARRRRARHRRRARAALARLELVDEALGDEPVPPLSPRVAVRAAEYTLPAGLVAELDARLREHDSADRLDEVLEELTTRSAASAAGRRWPRRSGRCSARRRSSTSSPRSAGASSSTSSATWSRAATARRRGDRPDGRARRPAARRRRRAGRGAARGARGAPRGREGARRERGGAAPPRALRRGRRAAAPLGARARPAGRVGDGRAGARRGGAAAGDHQGRPGIRHRRGDDRGGGDARHRPPDGRARRDARSWPCPVPTAPVHEEPEGATEPLSDDVIRIESPMVGTFYRRPSPAPPRSSRRATRSRPGRRSASSRR